MPPKFLRSFYHLLKISFLLSLSVIAFVNILALSKELKTIYKVKKIIPYSFEGLKFSGLEAVFKDTEMVGYYTDKDMKKDANAKQFAQAQLILAPTILDLNNLGHKYILFDCSSEQIAFQKIKEIGALALKKNRFGIILARRIR